MATELFLPFDETDGSTIAYDFSGHGRHAAVNGGRFIEGRNGNCVYYPGSGFSEIQEQFLNFAGVYTIMCWVMVIPQPGSTTDTFAMFKFTGTDREVKVNFSTALGVWTHLALTHSAGIVKSYVNGRPTDTKTFPTGWGTPTGLCIATRNGFADGGRLSMDEFKVLSGELYTEQDIIPIITNTTLSVKFFINGVDFDSMGIKVKPKPRGLTDKLQKKESNSYDWADQHGRQVSLVNTRYEPRTIELDCFFKTFGTDDMMERQMTIKDHFQRDGTQRLMVQVATKPLVYEVHHPEGIDFSDMKWRSGKAFCEFTLKLVETQPVKRVLMYNKSSGSTPPISITLSTPDYNLLTIYWGDGTVTHNVFGTNVTITHTYTDNGVYYPIITGVIEDITSFTHNAVLVWNKLQ